MAPSSTSLDIIAAAHQLEDHRNARLTRHQQQRADWRTWLHAVREALRENVIGPKPQGAASDHVAAQHDHVVEDEYLAAVLATGPPLSDQEQHALKVVRRVARRAAWRPGGLNAGSG